MKRALFIFLFSIIFFSNLVFATEYSVESVPNPKLTNANAFVSNPDGILKVSTVENLNRRLYELEQQTSAEVAVVVLNSIAYEDIKTFAVELFEKWGIGKAKHDNGLLILFVLDQRAITFETGYGLEGVIPDAIAKRVQTQAMLPEFKNEDYDAGFIAGIEMIDKIIREEPVPVSEKESGIQWNSAIPFAISAYLILILLTIFWLNSSVKKTLNDTKLKTNLDRYKAIRMSRSGICSTIGFFLPIVLLIVIALLFNAGYLIFLIPIPFTIIPVSILGKKAMNKARKAPFACNACGNMMRMLSENDEDKYLKLSQQFEEQLQALDYDVFLCDNCQNEVVFMLDLPSVYIKCPKCSTKAFAKEKSQIILAPTYISTGIQQTTYKCKFCGFEDHKNKTLPRLQRTNVYTGSGGGYSSGRGGFGGGGSFGGGSFGGGRSGGGGATSRW